MVTGPTSDAPSRERPGAAGVRPRRWPGRPDEGLPATLIAGALAGVMLLPIATILVLSLSPQQTIWPHLFGTVLPRAVANTLLLMAGVGALALVIGTGTAWLVTMYRFPGRGLLDRLLVLPLAMPTYIVAYCYVDVFDYSGPVQTALRALFGWQSARDYWFPDIRTLPGCILVLSTVLYPYVYLAARQALRSSRCACWKWRAPWDRPRSVRSGRWQCHWRGRRWPPAWRSPPWNALMIWVLPNTSGSKRSPSASIPPGC